jgi:hypothetical protein
MVLQAISTYYNNPVEFGYIIGMEKVNFSGRLIEPGICTENCAYFFSEGDISQIVETGVLNTPFDFERREESGYLRKCFFPSDFHHENPISTLLDGIEHTVLIASKSEKRMRLFYEKTTFTNGKRRTSAPPLHEVHIPDNFEVPESEFKHMMWVHSPAITPIYFASACRNHMPVGYAIKKVYETLTERDSATLLSGNKNYVSPGVAIYVFGSFGCQQFDLSNLEIGEANSSS